MATCESCGATVEAKNAAGHYRDKCPECIQAVADERTPHVEVCEDPECGVCLSYQEEVADAR